MENSVQPKKRTDDEVQAFYAMFVLLICVACSKEPEFRCEYCDKVYKQQGWYHAHIAKCAVKDKGWGGGGGGGGGSGSGDTGGCISIKSSEFDELLRQNRDMLALLQKQQETIQTLVSQLVK